jgi:excisionase family DNA binding protein
MTEALRTLMQDLPDTQFLKPVEVASLLSVSVKTVFRWCDMGLIESIKLNRSVRVLRDSVVEFLERP